jgi:hypothetical protein
MRGCHERKPHIPVQFQGKSAKTGASVLIITGIERERENKPISQGAHCIGAPENSTNETGGSHCAPQLFVTSHKLDKEGFYR